MTQNDNFGRTTPLNVCKLKVADFTMLCLFLYRKKSSTACHPESVKSSIHVLVVLMYQPTSRISGFVLVIYGPILAGHFITITAKPTTRQRGQLLKL